MDVENPQDVDVLLERLADTNAGTAQLVHLCRPPVVDQEGMAGPAGAEIIDHDVVAAAGGGFGYLSYGSPEFDHAWCVLAGDPNSPRFSAEPMDWEAGTGVPVETLAKALKEFLATAQRPTCVEWQDAFPQPE